MATELPRPGVEIVQQFASTSPTIVTPTLVPCIIAPFFEVIEALQSDGTINTDAKLETLYEQLEQTVLQASFPSPRDNIDEVDVQEDTVRVFFEFGGALRELSRESAFLTSYLDTDITVQPYVEGTTVEPVGGYDLDGRTLILLLDGHTALPPTAGTLPTAGNITITFAAATPGGTLTLQEVIDQVNARVPGLASASATDTLVLTSTRFGAGASVVVRKQGSANAGGSPADRLGFSAADDEISVGSGFYAIDDSDGDTTSPRLSVYEGNVQDVVGSLGAGYITAPSFLDDHIEIGDDIIADGIAIGQVSTVESDLLTMEVEQNIISQDAKFAPRRVWVEANNLVYPAPAASEAATITGTLVASAASRPFVIPQGIFVGTTSAPSESISVDVTEDGVALATETVSSGTGVGADSWDTLAYAITQINAQATVFEVYAANDVGDEVAVALGTHLGFRTLATNAGSGAIITVSACTVETEIGFTSLPVADIGEDVRYRPGTPAIKTSRIAAPIPFTMSNTVIYTPTYLGAAKASETITWAAAHASIAAAVADWNAQAIFTEAYASLSTGVESATGTYLSFRTRNENVGITASIEVTGGTDGGSAALFTLDTGVPLTGTAADLNGKTFEWSLDGNLKVWSATLQKDQDDNGTSLQSVIDKINDLTPGIASASDDSPPALSLTSVKLGEASKLLIGSGTSNTILGFTPAGADVGNGRPAPDLAIDISGNAIIQSQVLRDGLTGIPFNPGFAPIVISYKGLRLDLSPEADNPALLTIDDISTLEEAADPISTDNPGALMVYLALLNATATTVAAIGVPEVSDDAPDGTPLGYARCAEFLENEEVYALATASQLSTVHQTFLTHVNSMSEPEQKGERIYFFNPPVPDRANPDLLGSGTDLNTTATANECTIDVNLAPALIAAGIDPNLDINPTTGEIENEVYLDIGDDDKYYLVQKVTSGTTVTLRTSFVTGDGNDDAFYSSDAFPTVVISDDWTIAIRGAELLTPGTTRPDRQGIAETIQASAQAFGFRRGYYVFPDQVGINVTGLEQVVNGYYATGCIAGMVGQQPPQQGFTNFPITGLTRSVGSNDQFSNRQLNVIAAGGVYILVKDSQGAPVICRHQLSTDVSSIETRELSITKVVDFTAKFMRAGLRNFIGRSNITQGFLDSLSTVVQGQLNFLVEGGVLIGADVNNLIQDASAPDTILVDVTIDVPFPANFLRLVLSI